MIEVKNLRLEEGPEWTKLVADICAREGGICLPEETMWFALPNEHARMFNTEVYDPFVLVPYYMGMFYGQDVKICGKVSKLFYKNLTNYASQILDDYSPRTRKVALLADGFGSVEQAGSLIGSSFSCGVDSLNTVYDRYVKENDPDYKINSLFLFNCGTHGDYGNTASRLWRNRFELNKKAASALGLPLYCMDSNLHAFTHHMYPYSEPSAGYFALFSCILCLQKAVYKYYFPSDCSYKETLEFNRFHLDYDISAYASSMLTTLIRTERCEIILDGAQYKRAEKLEHIADWEIAQKYMNICVRPLDDGRNCTVNCKKCREVLLMLESLGKADLFRDVFNIDLFRKQINQVKINTMARSKDDLLHSKCSVDFVKAHGMKMPSYATAVILHSPRKIKWLVKQMRRRTADRKNESR